MKYNLGKRGLTEEFIAGLEKTFKKRDLIKISVLQTATRDREEIKIIAQKICDGLGKRLNKRFTAKIVGFTMFVKKWRR
jgi:RNA-binding protein YhbY